MKAEIHIIVKHTEAVERKWYKAWNDRARLNSCCKKA